MRVGWMKSWMDGSWMNESWMDEELDGWKLNEGELDG